MKLLLDAHVVLWAIYSPDMLSGRARAIIEDESNEFFLSHAGLWELLNKIGRRKLLLAGTDIRATVERIDDFGITFLPIQLDDIMTAASLPHHHSDPFDRMLVAHAIAYSLPVLTADTTLSRYAIEVIWM